MAMMARSDDASRSMRIALNLGYPSVLIAAMLSGCTSPAKLRWSEAEGPYQSSRPTEVARGPAGSDLPKRRGRSKPATAPAEVPREADVALVLTTSEVSASGPKNPLVPAVPAAEREYPIDLTTALRLAEAENPRIAEARQRIGEALAVRQGARALLLPTLNVGTNLHEHTGNLQRSSGRILNLNESSLYVGGGTGAVAASLVEVPAVTIYSQLTDAVFEPLAAQQRVEESRFVASATANTILREVAELHFELLAAEADLRVRREAARQAEEVAQLTRAYADAQQGREADAERASTELTLIVREVQEAEGEAAVASARLSHRLHLDQSVRLRPLATIPERVTLIDPEAPLPVLIQAALAHHPMIGARAAGLAASEVRHNQERYRPLLPTVLVGFSGGGFGGGSNLAPPQLSHFAGRTDFDVSIFWTLRNFGVGNLSLQKRRWAEVGQAVGERSRAIAEIRSEVSASYAEVASTRQQVDLATRRLSSAELGFQEDLDRIRNTVARPIEVVNSLQLLNQARVARIRAVTDYNKAEFRLFVSLGSPPPLGTPGEGPAQPPPLTFPPVSPAPGAVVQVR